MKKLIVQDTLVSLTRVNDDDYISLTDIARVRNPDEPKDVVKNWLRNRATVEYLGLWEKINNASFKGVEFDPFKNQAGSNSCIAQPERLKTLNELAIGQLRSLLDYNTAGKLK